MLQTVEVIRNLSRKAIIYVSDLALSLKKTIFSPMDFTNN